MKQIVKLKDAMILKGFKEKNFLPGKNQRDISNHLNYIKPYVEEALKKLSYRATVTTRQVYEMIVNNGYEPSFEQKQKDAQRANIKSLRKMRRKEGNKINLAHVSMVMQKLGCEKIALTRYTNVFYTRNMQEKPTIVIMVSE